MRPNDIILPRHRALIISRLGLAVISMLVFGFLFGGNGSVKTRIGVVDQDHSNISAQVASQLQKSNSLQVYTGMYSEEQQALTNGYRDAVIVVPAGFGTKFVQGGAHLQLFYAQTNPVSAPPTQLTVKT